MKFSAISCDVLYRELCHLAAGSPHRVDLCFLPKGLHDLRATEMRDRLQAKVDELDGEGYDAILLGYGLCNNGLHGIASRTVPLVLPRAHDCMTLFFGSRERYLDYFWKNPGVYFKTSGWIERGEPEGELRQASIGHLHGMDKSFEEMVAEYGEDNALYLYETLVESQVKAYRQFTFIEMGVEPDDRFERATREQARDRGWAFEKVRGSLTLLERLVNGDWDAKDFLVVEPGRRIVARYDEGVVSSG
jgi:hypothetical protein